MNPNQARGFRAGYWFRHNFFPLLGACSVFVFGAALQTIISKGIAFALRLDRRYRWIFFGVSHFVKLWNMPCTKHLVILFRQWPRDRPYEAAERELSIQKSLLFVLTFVVSSLFFHNFQAGSSILSRLMSNALRLVGYTCIAILTIAFLTRVLAYSFLRIQHYFMEVRPFRLISLHRLPQLLCWLVSLPLRAFQSSLSQLLQIHRHIRKAYAIRADALRKKKFSGMKEFRYKPLSNARDIRLLQLGSLDSFAGVTCELIHTSLDRAPKYEAISYTWGDPKPIFCVSVDCCRLLVPATAYEIIQARCTIRGPRYIWMDFVCIDQSNDNEKKIQIPLMREIYKSASCVVAWLGDSADGHKVDALLKWIDRELRPIEMRRNKPQGKDILQRYSGLEPRSLLHPSHFTALFSFLSNPFWQRVWIKQEIALGTEVHILYAGYYICWETLIFTLEWMSRESPTSVQQSLGPLTDSQKIPEWEMDQVLAISSFRDKIKRGYDIRLTELLHSFSQAKATVAQDKVYGLLGVASGPQEKMPRITYGPVEDVYLETATYLLTVEVSLNFLHQAGIGYEREVKFQRLPSWVPNWYSPPKPCSFIILQQDTSHISHRYFPLQNAPSVLAESCPVVNKRELLSQCTLIDEIEKVGALYMDASQDADFDIRVSLDEVRFWHDEISLITLSIPDPYPNGQRRDEALWRTLIGDRTPKERPAPGTYSDLYETWRSKLHSGLGDPSNPNPSPIAPNEFLNLGDAGTLEKRVGLDHFNEWKFQNQEFHKFDSCTRKASLGRKFATTKMGYMALVPPHTKPGDSVFILAEVQTPFVLRKSEGADTFHLVGESYVHGLMDGEWFEEERDIMTIRIK